MKKLKQFINKSNKHNGPSHSNLIEALNEGGYWSIRRANNSNCYVKLSEGILEEVNTADMKEYILRGVKLIKVPRNKKEEVLELIHKKASVLFSKDHLEMLPILKLNLLKDSSKASYLCFQNGILKVTAYSFAVRPYSECKYQIWKSQIIQRDFHVLAKEEQDPEFEYEVFLQNICGKDSDRLVSLKSILGYLLHDYKNPGRSYAIIFLDENISDNNQPNGRTGKGLIVISLSQLRKTVTEDGKRFSSKRTFSLQTVTIDTKLLVLDDVGANFIVEEIFSMITEGMTIEKKYLTKYIIPKEESPKIILTSNYVLAGHGASNRARRVEFELSTHYSDKHEPKDDFGNYFFEEWKSDKWDQFDNLMINCLQQYLKNGLIKPKVINKDFRLLVQETSFSFAQFSKDSIVGGKKYISSELFTEFVNFLHKQGDDEPPTPKMFNNYLKNYALVYDLKFISKKSNSKTIVLFLSS